jgi:HlyD family secretion protein
LRRRPTLFLFLVLVIVSGSAAYWRVSRATPVTHYLTAPVTRGPITRTITASGSLNPVTTIQVGTYVSGPIQELYCDFNTVVRKGQLCAKIDPRPYETIVAQDKASLSTANAQLAKDETTLAYARVTLHRTAALRASGIVSDDQLDNAKSLYEEASAQVQLDKADIQQRQAALDAAEINLAYTNIVSPVDGTVVSRNVTMGQTVAASFQTPTLFLIATDLTKMQVDTNVAESDIGGIALNAPAAFTVEAFPTHVFDGRVTQVRQAPQMVQNVVTYDAVISVANPDLLLKPGMTATVRIVVSHRDNVLRVPGQALRYTPRAVSDAARRVAPAESQAGNGGTVWLLREGQPTPVRVVVGLDDDASAEIVQGGLQPGEAVITSEQTTGSMRAPRMLLFRP